MLVQYSIQLKFQHTLQCWYFLDFKVYFRVACNLTQLLYLTAFYYTTLYNFCTNNTKHKKDNILYMHNASHMHTSMSPAGSYVINLRHFRYYLSNNLHEQKPLNRPCLSSAHSMPALIAAAQFARKWIKTATMLYLTLIKLMTTDVVVHIIKIISYYSQSYIITIDCMCHECTAKISTTRH